MLVILFLTVHFCWHLGHRLMGALDVAVGTGEVEAGGDLGDVWGLVHGAGSLGAELQSIA